VAARGSGIGASGVNVGAFATGIGPSAPAGRAASPATASMYGGRSGGGLGSHTAWLLALVALEALGLVSMRRAFHSAHGG
jgi:hypothetical protein